MNIDNSFFNKIIDFIDVLMRIATYREKIQLRIIFNQEIRYGLKIIRTNQIHFRAYNLNFSFIQFIKLYLFHINLYLMNDILFLKVNKYKNNVGRL